MNFCFHIFTFEFHFLGGMGLGGGTHACAAVHLWRSEDSLWVPVLSVTMWVVEEELRSSDLVASDVACSAISHADHVQN